LASIDEAVVARPSSPAILARALRVHQWSKNVLLFAPLLLSHRFTDVERVTSGVLAVTAFCLAASAVYLVNDVLDLEGDRQHPQKRLRPLASGLLSIPTALVIAGVAMAASVMLSLALVSGRFSAMLLLYVATTMAYSFWLKRVAVLDVLLLAGLYTLRVVAGAIATDVRVSPWFLAFSLFFFLSLAFLKRYTELALARTTERPHRFLSARGYAVDDLDLIRSIGPTSGYLAVAVLALYIASPEVHVLYHEPGILWLVGPVLLYWITRVWLLAHRGQMHGDPVVFALADRPSWMLVGVTGFILLLAHVGLS
jgi:4-hydroxybenzoate polyprenyltransferase